MHFLVIFIDIYVTGWLLCAHPLMTSINFILEESTLNKTSVTYLISMFRLMFIFEFWLGKEQLIHISPFHSRNYVLMCLGSLEVSNRVSNWNKGKHFIFVGSMLQICQLELPVIITKFMWWFEFSRYFYWNVGNRLTFMCSPPNDKYKFHSRGPNTQENVSYILHVYVSADVHFSNFD